MKSGFKNAIRLYSVNREAYPKPSWPICNINDTIRGLLGKYFSYYVCCVTPVSGFLDTLD